MNLRKAVFSPNSIASQIEQLAALPVSWFVKRQKDQALYQLVLRTFQIHNLYDQVGHFFDISASDFASDYDATKENGGQTDEDNKMVVKKNVMRHPELILKLCVSLNEIEEVTMQDLLTFPELRSLDASLNTVHSFDGISVATKLVSLNLSYNNIRTLPNEALAECVHLQNLDLSVNKISSLSGFPVLPNLVKLQLRSNKLADLQGLQVLRSVKFVNVEKNKISNIVHVCACLELTELNIANNSLHTVSDIVASVAPLKRLKQLCLLGNPILSKVPLQEVQAAIVRESAVVLLDGVNIRPIKSQFESFSHWQPPSPRDEIKMELRKAVKESMEEKIQRKREKIQNNVHFLHKKILLLLEELDEDEDAVVTDTDAWCRYIDTLSIEEAKSLTVSHIRAAAITEADGYVPPPVPGSSAHNIIPKMSRKQPTRHQPDPFNHDAVLNAVAHALKKDEMTQ